MNEAILHAQSLSRTFITGSSRLMVLKNIDMQIREGEILALTGASGVGKSTLLHLLGGLDRPSGGNVLFKGRSLSNMTDEMLADYRNHSVGFVFQFHHLLPEFTAIENIAMPLLIRGVLPDAANTRSAKMLEQISLLDRKNHKPSELSGGEQQRIALARAMVTNPEIIFADEPTGNLDEETALDVFRLIQDLNREFRIAFVIATHNLSLARAANRWLRLTDGRIEPVAESEMTIVPSGAH